MPEPTIRRRRTAEESRRRILEAAQKRLAESGPEGLRLQELAADLGLSHPAILHHFGSREGLMTELATHSARGLNEELGRRIRAGAVDLPAILDLTAETLANRGQARLLAWLALSGRQVEPEAQPRLIQGLAELSHAARAEHRAAEGRPEPPYEDTVFSVLLVALALFGDALIGDLMRSSAGLDDPRAGDRFRLWLSRLLETHLGEEPS